MCLFLRPDITLATVSRESPIIRPISSWLISSVTWVCPLAFLGTECRPKRKQATFCSAVWDNCHSWLKDRGNFFQNVCVLGALARHARSGFDLD
jgi:hypothetical protein